MFITFPDYNCNTFSTEILEKNNKNLKIKIKFIHNNNNVR